MSIERLKNPLYQEDLDRVLSIGIPWDELSNKKILITGSTGLIGTFLVDVLVRRKLIYEEGINIAVLSRSIEGVAKRFLPDYEKCLNIYVHNLIEPLNYIEETDYIIHAAGIADPTSFSIDPVGTVKANLIGTLNILEYARSVKAKRVLFISTGEVYGDALSENKYFQEEEMGYINSNDTRSCYPESKRLAETLCASFKKQFGLDYVIARLCHIYGPTMKENDSHVISQFIRSVLTGDDIIMKSQGTQNRSLCYVADAVSGLLTILVLGKSGEVYNVSIDNVAVSIKDIADIISKNFVIKIRNERPTEIEEAGFSKRKSALLSSSKLKKLGWRPKFTFEESIIKTIRILLDLKNSENQ
jgi:nucleoside-diphosphate-sugar epimerase